MRVTLHLRAGVFRASAIVLAVMLVGRPAAAQSINGALDILLPVGARAAAMGTAIVAERGGESIWWNPAGIARLAKPEFAIDHFSSAFIESGDAASLVLPVGPIGVFAVGARLFNYGGQVAKDNNNIETGTASTRSTVLSSSFAASFGERFSAGLTFRLYQFAAICSGICGDALLVAGDFTTGMLDAGVQYRTSPTSPLEFGAVMSNLGPSLQVHDLAQADALPTTIRVGLSYRPTSTSWDPAIRLRTTAEFVTTPSLSNKEIHLGGELGYVAGDATLTLRGGYIYQQAGTLDSSAQPSVGFGIASGRVQLDFAQLFDPAALGKPPRYVSIRLGL